MAAIKKQIEINAPIESVWRYLFTHPVEITGRAVPVDSDFRMDQR